jgi:hypothetical protein
MGLRKLVLFCDFFYFLLPPKIREIKRRIEMLIKTKLIDKIDMQALCQLYFDILRFHEPIKKIASSAGVRVSARFQATFVII